MQKAKTQGVQDVSRAKQQEGRDPLMPTMGLLSRGLTWAGVLFILQTTGWPFVPHNSPKKILAGDRCMRWACFP
jgi:hypothetical protein